MHTTSIRTFVVIASMLAVAALAMVPAAARADQNTPATAEELEAKARVFTDKAKQYREEAQENRGLAERHKNARDAKGRAISSPAQRKLVAALQAMAAHDEMLAKDAEKVAAFYTRQAEAARAGGGEAK